MGKLEIIKSKNFWSWVAIVACLANIGFFLYLTIHFYQLKFGINTEAICNINQTFNCDVATISDYAHIFGVPLALLGLVTHAVLLLFIFVQKIGSAQNLRALATVTFLTALFVVVTALVMGSISVFIIKAYCIHCIITYFFSCIALVATIIFLPKPLIVWRSLSELLHQQCWILVTLCLIPCSGYLTDKIILREYAYDKLTRILPDQIIAWKLNKKFEFNASSGLIQGTNTATFIITEFFGFYCPHCKDASPILHAFVGSHPNVLLVAKPVGCRVEDGTDINCQLNKALICAKQLSGDHKAWRVHDWIFSRQQEIFGTRRTESDTATYVTELFAALTRDMSLEPGSFQNCINDAQTLTSAASFTQESETAEIRGVPAVFVNGRLLPAPGGHLLPVLQEAYANTTKAK